MLHNLVSVLVLGIDIARGQYYWILGGLLGIILTLLFMLTSIAQWSRKDFSESYGKNNKLEFTKTAN